MPGDTSVVPRYAVFEGKEMAGKSEKQKMISGELYRAADEELTRERIHARRLTWEYNGSAPGDVATRAAILSELFGTIGANCEIEPPFHCDYGYNIRVGDNFYANFNCIILDCAPVNIGSNVLFGPNVQIYGATHPLHAMDRKNGLEFAKPVTIEDDVWIGGGAIINAGVTIGSGSTIDSGSVVTRDIPANVFAAGNPCRIIRRLE